MKYYFQLFLNFKNTIENEMRILAKEMGKSVKRLINYKKMHSTKNKKNP